MKSIKNEQDLAKNFHLTNNAVAFLAVLLMFISLMCSSIVYHKASVGVTGRATTNGQVTTCINHLPVLNEFPSILTAREGNTLVYDVNATDADNATQNLTFYDNTSLFNIASATGIINFTPSENSAGTYNVLITVEDNSSCSNSNTTQVLIINITSENIAPSITAYSPLGNPTITEEQTRFFNITYEDDDGDNLVVYWYLNDSLVSLFNDTTSIGKSNYTFTGNYTNSGVYNVEVNVSDGLLNDSHNWILTVTNINRLPGFNRTIKNQTWAEDSTLYGLDLDDYSYDYDIDDTLSYSVDYLTSPHSIQVNINSENVITLSQPADWYGSENISFTVADNHGASNTSNNITLTVYDVPETNITVTAAPVSGSGRTQPCIEQWLCGYWSACSIEGYMTRACQDLSNCGTEYYKPAERKECEYIPSCFNSIKDGDETDVDCGGKCGTCASCFDGVMNKGETGIDCGGLCPPCPTCFDGIINGGEIGIDCGGACQEQACCLNGYRDAHLGELGIDCGGLCQECRIEIEKPAPKRLYPIIIWIIGGVVLIGGAMATLSTLIYLRGKNIKSYLLSLIEKAKKEEKKVSKEIRKTILLEINKLEGKLESKPPDKALKEFLTTLRTALVRIFKVKYEFTLRDITPMIHSKKLKPVVKWIFTDYIHRITHIAYSGYRISKEELTLLKQELRIIIYLITRSSKEEELIHLRPVKEKGRGKSDIENFYVALTRSLYMLEKKENEQAESEYADAKDIFSKLTTEDKEKADNYMERIGKEVELFKKRRKRQQKVKEVLGISIALMIVLSMASLDIFFGSNITGLSTFEPNHELLINIKGFNIEVGEHFVYKIRGYGKEGDASYFSDDTKLFNINNEGVIDFTPQDTNIGVHHVTLIVKDTEFRTSAKDVVFNITRKRTGSKVVKTMIDVSDAVKEENLAQQSTEIQKDSITEEANLTGLGNETKEINITLVDYEYEETNLSEDIGQQLNLTNETKIPDLTNETALNLSQSNTTESGDVIGGADTLIKPLDIYVDEFQPDSFAEFNLLVENTANREIENAYFRIFVLHNNSSIIDIQSTPINIEGGKKEEMIAHWNPANVTFQDYTGKLLIIYEDIVTEYGIRTKIEPTGVQAEIIGVTGMVTAPSSAVTIESAVDYGATYPSLIWLIVILSVTYTILLLRYLKNKK